MPCQGQWNGIRTVSITFYVPYEWRVDTSQVCTEYEQVTNVS